MAIIKKKTLYKEIADNLRDMIIAGKLKEGDKIKEQALCSLMGTSRTPLREAIRVLSSEGLIELIPNHGAYVSKPTFVEIKEMFDVMTVLEGVCARTAAEKMNDKALSTLEKLHEKLEEKCDQRDQKGYIRYNNQYHSFVQELAGNRILNQIVNGLRQKILLYRYQSLSLPGRFEGSIQEHRELLEAFRRRDPEKAETLMKIHLTKQCAALGKLT